MWQLQAGFVVKYPKILESVVNDTITRHVYTENNPITACQSMGISPLTFEGITTNTLHRNMEKSTRLSIHSKSSL